MLNFIVTCGPAYAPIDQVRRLTNFSTGRLGAALVNYFTDHGANVLCLRGEGATCPELLRAARVQSFSTNEDLLNQLKTIAPDFPADAVFHAAALSDFRLREIRDANGRVILTGKMPSRTASCQLILEPAPKVLPQLRSLFPTAKIVGWKYEVDGTEADVRQKGQRQLTESANHLCVMNGPAYGAGFGLLTPDGSMHHEADVPGLAAYLLGMTMARTK